MPFVKIDARIDTFRPLPECFNAQHEIIPCPTLTGKVRIALIVVCSIIGALVLGSAVFYFCEWCCCCWCHRKHKDGTPAEAKQQESDSDEDARPLRTDEEQYQPGSCKSEDTVRGYADDKSSCSEQYAYDDMDRQLNGMFRTAYDDDNGREASSYSYPPMPYPGPSYGGRAYAGGGIV